MKIEKWMLLSFDIEEFDTPLEYGKELDLEEQFSVSFHGLNTILQLLKKYTITATFFTTANFALRYPDEIKKMSWSYEIASHGYYHGSFKYKDLLNSKVTLEKIIEKNIYGYRMARMVSVNGEAVKEAGYVYNASLHPTFIPGRYNNLDKPRTYFMKNEVLQIPASVTPKIRFPLFWLSFKNFPLSLIKQASKYVIKKDGYVNLYFHPWEFSNTTDTEKFGLPFYVSNNGKNMVDKLEKYIKWCQKNGYTFHTYYDLYKRVMEL